ncbi:hypothetical protein SPRG_03643 [Saprolegnia parasitica CBS 223.65]|uniref:Spindle pole body component n=1 Tax=Saprolegnia parasitica (strain CBS 223.65) TaxID=695850 RepID=A0A067CZ00_SAPPC|nr:hypothetical protein SPRG_03643 [Saprolegnia parasitica CBS 223.65]KDO31726.1 hypothetical protein SPRG_03643 [Saprolegnia parasitica CBS 223.65]|eukprot:XP_012197608.1 hypothetical protein SPRG_03643 [Saprolegnia parasitica CBS 223.65]
MGPSVGHVIASTSVFAPCSLSALALAPLQACGAERCLKHDTNVYCRGGRLADLKAFSLHEPGDAEYSEYIAAQLRPTTLTNLNKKVVYLIDVHLGKVHWLVHTRYSALRKLRCTLFKHLSKRADACRICYASLKGLQATVFPPKARLFAASIDMAMRQLQLATYVQTLVRILQVLRQHSILMQSRVGCDVTPMLRLLEEFVGLDFSRYTSFLADRGVLHPQETVHCR